LIEPNSVKPPCPAKCNTLCATLCTTKCTGDVVYPLYGIDPTPI
jgi:hypothetical protein